MHAKSAKGLIRVVGLVAALALGGCTRTTPTEAKAIAVAQHDHTAYTLPPQRLAKAHRIATLYDTLYVVGTAWGMVSLWLILRLGVAARIRQFALARTGRWWGQSLIFLLALLLLMTLLRLPLSVYAHHLSLGYGYSVQGWGSWLGDVAKSFLLDYGVGCLLVLLVFFLIRRFPRRWWLILWGPTMALAMFGVYLSPLLVDPLFNQFEPLSKAHPELVEQIERVAAHGGFAIPPDRMYVMKASEKTTLLNAYVTGFGSSKRLVIWDTLLKKATPDEIVIIAGHEMGHYVLGHIARGMLESFAGMLAAFFIGFHVFQFLLRRCGTSVGDSRAG